MTTTLLLLAIVALPYALGLLFGRINPGDTNDEYTPRWMMLSPWSR